MGTKQQKEIEVDWDKVHQSNFENAAFNPVKWTGKAVDLLVTAKKLEPEIIDTWAKIKECLDDPTIPTPANYLQEPYFMLISFAVENILKAKLIQSKQEEYKTNFREIMSSKLPLNKKLRSVFPDNLRTHDLYDLAMQAKLELKESEEDLLRRLSHNATWAGRYPTALNHRDFPGLTRFSNGKIFTLAWFGSDDVALINTFVNSLPERLGLHISHKWPIE